MNKSKISHKLIASAIAMAISSSAIAQNFTGVVTDDSAAPIPNAEISLVGTGKTVKTDEQGRFHLDIPASEVDELHVEAEGFSHKILHLHGESSEELNIVLRMTALEQMDVVGLPVHASAIESVMPVSVLAGDNLRDRQAATLGETLKNEVGVHTSFYGGAASSPIIRGFDGPRVMISQNSLDAADASRVGPDHAVATEASTAEQIEILRGPATLFYGSGAIGGVVNIVDKRVPTDSEFKGSFGLSHNTVSSQDEASLMVAGGGENFALHADGFWRDSDDYKLPSDTAAERYTEDDHIDKYLSNSASESEGGTLGASWLFDEGYIGLSYGRLDRVNGIPGHSHGEEEHHEEEHDEHEEEHEEHEEHSDEKVLSDLTQDRWQLLSEINFNNSWLDGIDTRLGYTDYTHKEIEVIDGVSEVGTVFNNETWQAKVDFRHGELLGWRGAFSVEAKRTDFEAVGEEAFTTPSQTNTYALAIVEEKHTGDFLWQLGARVESVTLKPEPFQLPEQHFEEEHEEGHEEEHHDEEHAESLALNDFDFTPYSVSAGTVWDFTEGYNLSVAYTHAQRAPSSAELFSVGPHIGTSSYEIGALFELHEECEPGHACEVHLEYHGDAKKEVSNNIDLGFRKYEGSVGLVLNLFYNSVEDYYYSANTGYLAEDLFPEEEHHDAGEDEHEEHAHGVDPDMPVYLYQQADVELYGLEAQLAWQINPAWKLNVQGDSVRGRLTSSAARELNLDNRNLPRMPAARLGSEILFEQSGWRASLGANHYFEQNDNAENETNTDSFTLVDARLSYTWYSQYGDLTLFSVADNLTDEEARLNTSYLKDEAPLPGRGVRVGIRGSF